MEEQTDGKEKQRGRQRKFPTDRKARKTEMMMTDRGQQKDTGTDGQNFKQTEEDREDDDRTKTQGRTDKISNRQTETDGQTDEISNRWKNRKTEK